MISMISWDEFAWLRIANIIAAILAMTIMGISFALRRKKTPRRYRRLAMCLYILLLVIAYASGRAASLGAPVAEHILFIFASLVTLAMSMLWHPEGDDSLPGPDDTAWPARARRAWTYYWARWKEGSGM